MSGIYSAVRLGADLRPTNGQTLATAETADELMHLWEPGRVVICWSYTEPPPRRLSPESLGRVRRKRLWRRLRSKHPLLAAQLYEAELAARPDHYRAWDACATDTTWRP